MFYKTKHNISYNDLIGVCIPKLRVFFSLQPTIVTVLTNRNYIQHRRYEHYKLSSTSCGISIHGSEFTVLSSVIQTKTDNKYQYRLYGEQHEYPEEHKIVQRLIGLIDTDPESYYYIKMKDNGISKRGDVFRVAAFPTSNDICVVSHALATLT